MTMPEGMVGQGTQTRRDVLRVIAVGAVAGAAWSVGLGSRGRAVTRSRVLMGTKIHLTVVDADLEAAGAAADATLQRMAALEARLSRYRPDSEVSRLQASGRLEAASEALLDVLRLADRVWRLGDGGFDVTVQPVLDLHRQALARSGGQPSPEAVERALARVDQKALRIEGRSLSLSNADARITLDGIGKGYVVDRGIDVLRERGFPNVFAEAGGDLVAGGEKASRAQPWRIGIRQSAYARLDAPGQPPGPFRGARPRRRHLGRLHAAVQRRDTRNHHIVDPRTGSSAPELASSTVIAPDAATADALATLTMVLGRARGRALLEDLPGCEGYSCRSDSRSRAPRASKCLMLVLTGVGAIGGLTLALATLLVLAHRRLYVEEDPRIDVVEEMLPHANCGACGQPGCRPFAEALVGGEALPGKCTVGSAEDQAGRRIAELPRSRRRRRGEAGRAAGLRRRHQRRASTARATTGCRPAAPRPRWPAAARAASGAASGLADCEVACDFDAIRMDAPRAAGRRRGAAAPPAATASTPARRTCSRCTR